MVQYAEWTGDPFDHQLTSVGGTKNILVILSDALVILMEILCRTEEGP